MKIEHSEKYSQYYAFVEPKDDDLKHHGIDGQKWGVRRWQNEDGSLTPAGYPHYGVTPPGQQKKSDSKDEMKKKYRKICKKGRNYRRFNIC